MKKLLHSRFFSDYGSIFVLVLLCAYYSFETVTEHNPTTPEAGREVAEAILKARGSEAVVIAVVRETKGDQLFAAAIQERLQESGARAVIVSADEPIALRKALEVIGAEEPRIDALATHHVGASWGPLRSKQLDKLALRLPAFKGIEIFKPASYTWPSFLTRQNLVNVINQNADIAIIAIGMTMVIITAGIDLSVGSLLALSGVVTAVALQGWFGGAGASLFAMIVCSLAGICVCALCGAFSGMMVTIFRVPAFVVTLGLMMVARGVALMIAVRYQSFLAGGGAAGTPEAVKIEAEAFGWLGNGTLIGIPNPIVLMVILYVIAHIVMSRTSFGRYVYAVGGNPEAARLSGVPVVGVLIAVYAIVGVMAGLGGIVDASRFEGGRPNAGELYELQVIAAVVVGGTSLAGGEGKIFGTLIGAMIIAVIQNGLNMAGVKSYEQKVVFGLLILAAVLLDQLKKRRWKRQ